MKEMIIYSGEALKAHVNSVLRGITKERDTIEELHKYVTAPNDRKVCCLYGLRRTGKTIMILQEMQKIADFDKCLMVECGDDSTIIQLREAIESHPDAEYIFVDEVTKARNFINAGSVLANRYAAEGKKVILAGTDSLGFYLARSDELYDRARFIHTTYIPFKEYNKLLNKGIMDYIKYGGTLSPENVFYNRATTNEYSNSAIVFNIVHSLEKWNQGRNYGVLREIVDNGDLPSFINKVIEYDSKEFLAKIINKEFESHDLGSLVDLLTKSGVADPEVIYPSGSDAKQMNVRNDIQSRIRDFLHIKDNQLEANPECVQAIIEYLTDLDVLYKIPRLNSKEEYLFTQTGMRYSQASDLSKALVTSEVFDKGYSDIEKREILKKIEEDICGGILEDIVLYQTTKALDSVENATDYFVSKYNYSGVGKEFDVYISNYSQKTSCVIEVKLSDMVDPHQVRHLTDETFCSDFERKSGTKISAKVVVYNGKTKFNPLKAEDASQKIIYINAEDYLIYSEKLVKALTENVISDKKSFCKVMKTTGIKLPSQDGGIGNAD